MLIRWGLILASFSLFSTGYLFALVSRSETFPHQTTLKLFLGLLFVAALVGLGIFWVLQKQWQLLQDPEKRQKQDLERIRKELEQELEVETARIDAQSRKLAERYRVIHEWMDYPRMLDLKTGEAIPGDLVEVGQQRSVAQSQRLAHQDRQVADLLASQAEVIYEKIRKNTYAPQGVFNTQMVRDDLMEIANRIARIYQPGLENPLLSTSPEQLARAMNRIGLHLLAVMDQLPIDLKSYNIQTTYDMIRRAIVTYGAYKKASPYLDWASKGVYFGRMVTSTNPITLGLMWGATELGKYGAQKIATQLIDRQAIGLLQSLIRVIGYEVASIYGGDIRYRDPNWCYAVELTHMMAAFPVSRESMQYALQEAGRLQLRNEYDRLSLYRALASGKILDRKQTHPDMLTEEERQKILELLEKAHHEVLHGKSTSQADRWKKGVQEHLGVQLSLVPQPLVRPDQSSHTRDKQILNYLISFLLHIKQQSPERTQQSLSRKPVWDHLNLKGTYTEESFAKMLQELIEEESLRDLWEFQPPDLDPNDPRVPSLLDVLSRLNAEEAPYSPETEKLLIETGLYFRRELKAITQTVLNSYREILVQHSPASEKALKEIDGWIGRAILYLQLEAKLPSDNRILAVYPDVTLHLQEKTGEVIEHVLESGVGLSQSYAVLVTETAVVLIAYGDFDSLPYIVWQDGQAATVENASSMLTAAARLEGGQCEPHQDLQNIHSIFIQAPMTARFHHYFAPLLTKVPMVST